jgi:hypothetical protein
MDTKRREEPADDDKREIREKKGRQGAQKDFIRSTSSE